MATVNNCVCVSSHYEIVFSRAVDGLRRVRMWPDQDFRKNVRVESGRVGSEAVAISRVGSGQARSPTLSRSDAREVN